MQMPASRTMPALLDELAEKYPDRILVTDGARRLSYAAFPHEVRRLARGFHAIGVRPMMGNRLEWLLVDFAVKMLGGVLVAAGADVPESVIDEAAARVQPDDMAAMMFTSGSTARSKAACFVHRGLIENMHGIGERMHLTQDDSLLMTVSIFWAFACANALFAEHRLAGSYVPDR